MNLAAKHLSVDELGEALTPSQQRHVRRCPSCAGRRASVLAVRAAVGSLPRTAEPSPSTLDLVTAAPPSRYRWRTALAVAACAIAAVLAAAWLIARSARPPMERALVEEIALDHLHYARRAEAAEVRGSTEEVEGYFERTLSFRPHLAPVEATHVVGGKRCRIAGSWSALVWLERAGRWLSLFALPAVEVAERGCIDASGVRVCGVRDPRGGSRVLAGNLPPTEMLRLLDESLE